MKWVRIVTVLVVVSASVLLTLALTKFRTKPGPSLTEGEALYLRGDMTALKGMDLTALRNSLPLRIKASRQLLIVVNGWLTCPGCIAFPKDRNETGIPGLWITYQEAPKDDAKRNVTIMGMESIRGLPEEVYNASPIAILVDFDARTVTPSPSSKPSWSDYLQALRKYDSCCKEQL